MPSQKSAADTGQGGPGAHPDSPAAANPARPVELTTGDVVGRMAREYLRPHWRLAALALFASAIVAAATGVLPVLIKHALDNGYTDQIRLLVAAGAKVNAREAVAAYFAKVNMSTIGQYIVATIQRRMFDRIMHADLAWVSSTHSGRFISGFSQYAECATRLADNRHRSRSEPADRHRPDRCHVLSQLEACADGNRDYSLRRHSGTSARAPIAQGGKPDHAGVGRFVGRDLRGAWRYSRRQGIRSGKPPKSNAPPAPSTRCCAIRCAPSRAARRQAPSLASCPASASPPSSTLAVAAYRRVFSPSAIWAAWR